MKYMQQHPRSCTVNLWGKWAKFQTKAQILVFIWDDLYGD